MLTSVSDANKQVSGLKFGADDYIVKPFEPKELIARLKKRGDHDIDLRISRMEFELSHASNYDVIIENINLEKTLKKVESLIKKHEKLEQKEFKK